MGTTEIKIQGEGCLKNRPIDPPVYFSNGIAPQVINVHHSRAQCSSQSGHLYLMLPCHCAKKTELHHTTKFGLTWNPSLFPSNIALCSCSQNNSCVPSLSGHCIQVMCLTIMLTLGGRSVMSTPGRNTAITMLRPLDKPSYEIDVKICYD